MLNSQNRYLQKSVTLNGLMAPPWLYPRYLECTYCNTQAQHRGKEQEEERRQRVERLQHHDDEHHAQFLRIVGGQTSALHAAARNMASDSSLLFCGQL